jgi:8-oxo-dGTP pyrophosphatase MutT (NUDIX family)
MLTLPLFSARPTQRRARAPRPAAGLLIRTHTDGADWYLLGKRTRTLGGCWSNFGGSLEPGEHPLAGALREFDEEAAVGAAALVGCTVAAVIDSGTPEVPYTLFVLDAPPHLLDVEVALQWEHDDVAWFRADAISDLHLHHGFRRAWVALPPLEAAS